MYKTLFRTHFFSGCHKPKAKRKPKLHDTGPTSKAKSILINGPQGPTTTTHEILPTAMG